MIKLLWFGSSILPYEMTDDYDTVRLTATKNSKTNLLLFVKVQQWEYYEIIVTLKGNIMRLQDIG